MKRWPTIDAGDHTYRSIDKPSDHIAKASVACLETQQDALTRLQEIMDNDLPSALGALPRPEEPTMSDARLDAALRAALAATAPGLGSGRRAIHRFDGAVHQLKAVALAAAPGAVPSAQLRVQLQAALASDHEWQRSCAVQVLTCMPRAVVAQVGTALYAHPCKDQHIAV